MNVQDVFNRVRRTFGDEAGVQITDADLLRWINDAQLQISIDNESLLEATGTTDIESGVAEYALPDNMNILRSLAYKGFRLKVLSFQEFNEYIDGFDAPDATNPYGIGVPQVFMVYANTITLFPTPNETTAAGLKVYYSKHPDSIGTLADALTVPDRYHNAVVDYCLQQSYELDEDMQKADRKQLQFNESVTRMRGQEKWTSQEYYPSITTLPEDETYGSHGMLGGMP